MIELPKIVEQRLRSTDVPAMHPDPSLLTGFVERVLPPRVRVEVIGHLSVCSECRLVVALSKSSAPQADAPTQVVYGWRPLGWSVLRWASGVATAAVLAASVFVARTVWVAEHGTHENPVAVNSIVSEPVVGQTTANTIVRPSRELPVAKSPARTSRRAVAAPDETEMVATGALINQMYEVGRHPNPITGTAAVPATGRDMPTSPATSALQWKIAGSGIVYESFDGGQSWQSVAIRDDVIFRCVTAIGSTVWAGGDGGALYRSEDSGQHWTSVALFGDTQAIPTDAIANIQFPDPQHGRITTGLGREWSTSDGGRTWKTQ